MSMKKMFRRIDREGKRMDAKEWERHSASFVPKRVQAMRREIFRAFKRRDLDYAKAVLDLHVKGLQDSEKGTGKGFTQEQTDAMVQNLQSLFEALKKKSKEGL